MIFLLKKLNFVYIFYNKMEYEKIHSTTTDIINKLDENGNIVTTKLKKVYKYGILQEKYYLNNKNKLHRDEDKPAQIEYFNKNKYIYTWYQNGKKHRDGDLPAYIRCFINGNIYILKNGIKITNFIETGTNQLG
jgi:hypothetical protein